MGCRFPSSCAIVACAPRQQQSLDDGGPGFAAAAVGRTRRPAARGCAASCEVGLAVADHTLLPRIERLRARYSCHQAELGLAALAAVRRAVRADADSASKCDPLRGEQRAPRSPAARRKSACGKLVRAEPILVGDHHQAVARARQLRAARNHAGQPADLVQAVDLFVGWLFDQRAVAIDEQDASAAVVRLISGSPAARSFSLRRADGDAQAVGERGLTHIADDEPGAPCRRPARRRRRGTRPAGSWRHWATPAGCAAHALQCRWPAARAPASSIANALAAWQRLRRLSSGSNRLHRQSGDRIGRNDLAGQRNDFRRRQQRAATRAPARPCAFDSVRRMARLGSRPSCVQQARRAGRTRCTPRPLPPGRAARARGTRAASTPSSSRHCRWDCSASRRTPAWCCRPRGKHRLHIQREDQSCSAAAPSTHRGTLDPRRHGIHAEGRRQMIDVVLPGPAEHAHQQVDGLVAAATDQHCPATHRRVGPVPAPGPAAAAPDSG